MEPFSFILRALFSARERFLALTRTLSSLNNLLQVIHYKSKILLVYQSFPYQSYTFLNCSSKCASNNFNYVLSSVFTHESSVNPFMPGGNKGHTYLNKPAAFSWRFALVCVTFLLPPGIKGLKHFE